jgi:O-acetyl-ADP-ribose deacetylase (regulator of RNase III)
MIFVKGDLLTSPVQYLAHQVNCKGVMGAGLAKQMRDQYPRLYEDYVTFIQDNSDIVDTLLGHCLCHYTHDICDHIIVNIFGQEGYGRNGNYTNYEAVYRGFVELKEELIADNIFTEDSQITVAIPYGFGCGLAGGDWDTMYQLFIKLETEEHFLFICYKL